MRRRAFINSLWLIALFIGLAACTGRFDREAVAPTAENYQLFYPAAAAPNVRVYEDDTADFMGSLERDIKRSLANVPAYRGLNILALSGGGQDGAYGAGFLNGWSASGNRPDFDIVTGISTGAIIAPFAFLGSDYDNRLERFYTQTSTSDISRLDIRDALFGRGFLADTSRLRAIIERELSDDLIAQISREYSNGRLLLIGTTNIDAERPVLWNIGAIAQLGTADARDLIRDIILASAAVPVVFEPVTIPVTNGSNLAEELHVDGSVTREIFAYPSDIQLGQLLSEAGLARRNNQLWIIHNKRLEPRFTVVPENAGAVGTRAFELLLRSRSVGDIITLLSLANRDGLQSNVTFIPREFSQHPEEQFDPVYMAALYRMGFAGGSQPSEWFYDDGDLEQQ